MSLEASPKPQTPPFSNMLAPAPRRKAQLGDVESQDFQAPAPLSVAAPERQRQGSGVLGYIDIWGLDGPGLVLVSMLADLYSIFGVSSSTRGCHGHRVSQVSWCHEQHLRYSIALCSCFPFQRPFSWPAPGFQWKLHEDVFRAQRRVEKVPDVRSPQGPSKHHQAEETFA